MLAALLLVLREGFEAKMLVALASIFFEIGRSGDGRGISYGTGTVAGLSALAGVGVLSAASSLAVHAGEVTEGITTWLAVAVLAYAMLLPVRRPSRAAAAG